MKNPEEFLAALDAMVEELRSTPGVYLNLYRVKPGIPEWKLERLEKSAGITLAPYIREFYRRTNGVQLVWAHEKSSTFDPDRMIEPFSQSIDCDWVWGDDTSSTGVIHLLPIENVLDPGEFWKGHIYFPEFNHDNENQHFEGKNYPQLSFRRSIRPFDFYASYTDAAFILYDAPADPPVVISLDSQADYNGPSIGTFSDYLDLLIRCKGWIWGRYKWKKKQNITLEEILTLEQDV